MTTRRLLPFLAVLAAAPGLAACGDDSDDSGDKASSPVVETDEAVTPQALASAATRTTAKGGLRISLRQTMSLGGQGVVPSTAEGVFDTKTKKGEMTLSMDLSAMPGGKALGGGKIDQRMVFDGFSFYMTSPLFERILPGGKKWMKIDLVKAGKDIGVDFSALSQGSGQDPTQALQYLKAASGDVREVGKEDVRGEPTTHYKATIDFNKVPDTAPVDQREALRKSIRQIIKLSGSSTSPMEVWVGEDGLVRRMLQTVGTKISGQSAQIKQRIDMYDFGTKVDVDIPPASETVDSSEIGSALGAGAGVGVGVPG